MVLRNLAAFLFILIPLLLLGQNTFSGTPLGSKVAIDQDGKKLKWEEGGHDYFVMFKSLLANNSAKNDCSDTTNCTVRDNPQGDSCLKENSFLLEKKHIPDDAVVNRAFLVWTGGVAPEKIADFTDHSVMLSFFHKGSDKIEPFSVGPIDITASRSSKLGTSENNTLQNFEFEGFQWDDSNFGYFTYRVDITKFFKTLHAKGKSDGKAAKDGISLYGEYTVSNLDCTEDLSYVDGPLMVSAWSIIVIYKSEQIFPKKLYMYNGFKKYQNEIADVEIEGFELPSDPVIRVTLMALEGDSGLQYASNGDNPLHPESLLFRGDKTLPWDSSLQLYNKCNRKKERAMNPDMFGNMTEVDFPHVEVFNQVSSVYGWNNTSPECIGGDPENPEANLDKLEYSIDVDTFIISRDSHDQAFKYHLLPGDESVEFRISGNQDLVITNFMVVSIDTKPVKFDIPGKTDYTNERELTACSCSDTKNAFCADRPFFYSLKVQNWGNHSTFKVNVKDVVSNLADYVPGSTEIKYRINKKLTRWETIPDRKGISPLHGNGYNINEKLQPCKSNTENICDTVWIRYKVMPEESLTYSDIIEKSLIISDSPYTKYSTNSDVPLRLKPGLCPSIAECSEPDLSLCGGYSEKPKKTIPKKTSAPQKKDEIIYDVNGCSLTLL